MATRQDLDSEPESPKARRRRRTREDVEGRIITVARDLFAERGYAAATTREIARIADVSETLLFRYFGDKAQLFDAVISAPFNELMEGFMAEQRGKLGKSLDSDGAHQMFVAVFDLFERNRSLLAAAYFGRHRGEEGLPPVLGMAPFFERALASQLASNSGVPAGLDVDTGVRLGFGMIASAVLMRDWLFAGVEFDRASVVETIEKMMFKALGPMPEN